MLKPINVTAKKVKNGYLIPDSPELKGIKGTEIIVKIIAEKSDFTPENIKGKSVKKKNPADDKTWKELAAEAAVDRYEKKSKNQVPSKLTEEQVRAFAKKYDVEDIHTVDDILFRLKGKRR